MREQDPPRRAHDEVVRRERGAEHGRNPQHTEEVLRHLCLGDPLRISLSRHVRIATHVDRDALEDPRFAPILVIGVRYTPALAVLQVLRLRHHQPIGCRQRQRPQQHRINGAEHRRRRANAQRERQHRGNSETRRAPQLAQRVPHILQQLRRELRASHRPVPLLGQPAALRTQTLQVAETAQCRFACIRRIHPAPDVLPRPHREMKVQLLSYFRLRVRLENLPLVTRRLVLVHHCVTAPAIRSATPHPRTAATPPSRAAAPPHPARSIGRTSRADPAPTCPTPTAASRAAPAGTVPDTASPPRSAAHPPSSLPASARSRNRGAGRATPSSGSGRRACRAGGRPSVSSWERSYLGNLGNGVGGKLWGHTQIVNASASFRNLCSRLGRVRQQHSTEGRGGRTERNAEGCPWRGDAGMVYPLLLHFQTETSGGDGGRMTRRRPAISRVTLKLMINPISQQEKSRYVIIWAKSTVSSCDTVFSSTTTRLSTRTSPL